MHKLLLKQDTKLSKEFDILTEKRIKVQRKIKELEIEYAQDVNIKTLYYTDVIKQNESKYDDNILLAKKKYDTSVDINKTDRDRVDKYYICKRDNTLLTLKEKFESNTNNLRDTFACIILEQERLTEKHEVLMRTSNELQKNASS